MADPHIGSVIAGQRIDGVLGRGGMGVVYRATDLALDRPVAVKVIAPALADDPALRRRFTSESRLAASLDHPNVIPIYRAGEEDGVLFLVMRLVEGEDLRSVLAREGPLPAARAVSIVTQVASALDAAHGAGLVHRDVKPANVLLRADGHAYLTDFGLSKRTAGDGDETRSAQLLGTVNYVAPEQIRGQAVDARTDVYALAGVLFQMLTGQVPFPVETDEGKLWAHLSQPPPKPSEVRPGTPRGYDAVIARGMAKEPAERHASAGELARAAAAVATDRPQPAAPAAAAPVASAPLPPARAPVEPYTRGDFRRALILNALLDSTSIVAAAAIVAAGLIFGAPVLGIVLAVLVYLGGATRAFFDSDVADRVLRRERERRRGRPDRRDERVDVSALSEEIRAVVLRAREIQARIHRALAGGELSEHAGVAEEVDGLVATMEGAARRAQLLHEGLLDAPPEAIERRLAGLRDRADPGQRQLVAALQSQLEVQRRMERQLRRFHDEMERTLVELDTVRGSLITLSATGGAEEEGRIAAGVRGLREEIGAVADGIAAAYADHTDAGIALERMPADA